MADKCLNRRTPPSVRKVELLGSWDNFQRAYPMEHDRRTGAGHWRGCHTFTDIICDGTSRSYSPGRSGGLKMGVTYWYYVCSRCEDDLAEQTLILQQYRLDGDIEYVNEGDPVTTSCPLLPGQPVNVLNVPFVLPDTHALRSRDNSVSPASSEHRTMDPKDKYMNPRTPPKPKPQLPRLKTSSPLHQQPHGLSGSSASDHDFRGTSQPAAFNNPPRFRLVPLRKQPARSVSPSPSRGLKTAFLNITQPRLLNMSGEDEHPRRSPKGGTARAPSSRSRSNDSSRTTSPASSPADGLGISRLPLRRAVVENNGHSPRPPLKERRASSRTRDGSPLPAPLTITRKAQDQGSSGLLRVPNLEPHREGLSEQNTPTPGSSEKPRTAIPLDHKSTPLDTEKRLPTLPNSPSSIMEEELRAINAKHGLASMEVLRSHFSDTTVDSSDLSMDSLVERSSFPDWTSDTEATDTDMISPASMTSSSSFNPDPSHHSYAESCTDSHIGLSKQESAPTTPTLSDGRRMSEMSAVTGSESSSLMEKPSFSDMFRLPDCDFGMSTLVIDDCYHRIAGSDSKRHAGMFTDLENLASTTSVAVSDQGWCASDTVSGKADTQGPTNHSSVNSYMTQSTMLKELMDELGYLGEMIQTRL